MQLWWLMFSSKKQSFNDSQSPEHCGRMQFKLWQAFLRSCLVTMPKFTNTKSHKMACKKGLWVQFFWVQLTMCKLVMFSWVFALVNSKGNVEHHTFECDDINWVHDCKPKNWINDAECDDNSMHSNNGNSNSNNNFDNDNCDLEGDTTPPNEEADSDSNDDECNNDC